jgi:hypothetical protein
MVEEYAEKSEAAEKVEPEVAFDGRRTRNSHELSTVTFIAGNRDGGGFVSACDESLVLAKAAYPLFKILL